jgi:hypothetical protein
MFGLKYLRCQDFQECYFLTQQQVFNSCSLLSTSFLILHLCAGYTVICLRKNYFLIFSIFTTFKMLAKIFLAALVASPLVSAHGKVSVVVSQGTLAVDGTDNFPDR